MPADVHEVNEVSEDADVGGGQALMHGGVGRLQRLAEGRHGGVEPPHELVETRADGGFQLQTAALQALGVVAREAVLVGEELLEEEDGGHAEDVGCRSGGGGFGDGGVGEVLASDLVDAGDGLSLLRTLL